MSRILEGTWDEIASHADELRGLTNLTLIVPSPELDENPLLASLQYEIERLKDLEPDWNGEGARAVNEECISRARALLRQAVCTIKGPVDSLRSPSVYPTLVGGVEFYWNLPGRQIALSISPCEDQVELITKLRDMPGRRKPISLAEAVTTAREAMQDG